MPQNVNLLTMYIPYPFNISVTFTEAPVIISGELSGCHRIAIKPNSSGIHCVSQCAGCILVSKVETQMPPQGSYSPDLHSKTCTSFNLPYLSEGH